MSPVISVQAHGAVSVNPSEGPQQPRALWVQARPDLRRIYTLAGDILAALGKDRALSGKGRNQQQDVTLAAAWLNASGISDLVVQNSELLHPIILTGLARLASNAGTTLWLLHQPPISDAVHRKIARLSSRTGTYDEVPQRAHTSDDQDEPSQHEPQPPIPLADFPLFLAALDSMPVKARNHTQQLFFQQRHESAIDFANTACVPSTAQQAMTTLLCAALPDEVLIPRIRGLQVAAWHRETFVDVDLNVLLASEERPTIPYLEADGLLVGYRQPHRAIVVALTMRQIGIEDVANLTIAEACEEGNIAINGTQLPSTPNLRCAVRAQRFLRIADGAQGSDQLLNYAAKSLSTFVNDAAQDLGIRAAGRRIKRQTDQTRWLKSLGIKIESIP